MFLGDPSRPVVPASMFQRLRLAEAAKRVARCVLDELDDPQRDTWLRSDPVGEVRKHLLVNDDQALRAHPAAGSGQPASTQARRARGEISTPSPRSARSIASKRRLALARDVRR